MSSPEVSRRLVRVEGVEARVSTVALEKELEKMVKKSWLQKQGGFYCLSLPKVSARELSQQRMHRQHIFQSKQPELRHLVRCLAWLPGIQEIYLTGALAVANSPSVDDDIDVCLVTYPKRLWLTRLCVITLTTVMRKYRLHDARGERSWCFNLWLDSDHLGLTEAQHSLYSAYELLQAKLLYGSRHSLLAANPWVSKHLIHPPKVKGKIKKSQSAGVFSLIGDILDFWCYRVQYRYMARRITVEKVARGVAFFHPRPTNSLVAKKYRKILTQLEKTYDFTNLVAFS